MVKFNAPKLKLYSVNNIDQLAQFTNLSIDDQKALKVVAQVLPFRGNNYVVENLIDWRNVPNDPIFQLTFMQKALLRPEQFVKMVQAMDRPFVPTSDIQAVASLIRNDLNPHPDGQLSSNVPVMDSEPVPGIQHKYKETVLIFPKQGQQCHAYCTYCFRWPQFMPDADLKFATDESRKFQKYLLEHKEVTDVLITGGDPMTMSAAILATYIEPLLGPGFEHIQNIRIGTKSLSYWPYKFVTDHDADQMLNLFEKVVQAGKHLAIMAHFTHIKELEPEIVKAAITRIRGTGAQIRTQSPLIKNINDDAKMWEKMWTEQVRLGLIPYYMFIERETGASHYFKIPISRAYDIFHNAIQNVSGLARTARGPVMSSHPGKVCVEGVTMINDKKVFILNFLQGRQAHWTKTPFIANYDETSTWVTDLKPAFGSKFFFEK